MTKEQARIILGISRSASAKTAERAYRQNCQRIQLRMIPGNMLSDRQEAANELLELTTAQKTWNTKRPKKSKRSKPRRTVNRQKPARQTPSPNLPQDLADAWDAFFSALPLPIPLIVAVLIAVCGAVIVSLLRNL